MSTPKSGVRPLAGSPLTLRLALLACVAILVGYYLPWVSLSGALAGRIGLSRDEVKAEAKEAKQRGGDEAGSAEKAARLGEGLRLAGSEWASVAQLLKDDKDLSERQRNVLGLMGLGLIVLPFAAGAMAVLLLLMSVRPRTAFRSGAGPLTLAFVVTQWNWLRFLLLSLTMALGLVTAGTGGVLWLATRASGPEGQAGLGVALLAAGGVVALVGTFLGYGRGRLRALLVAALLFAALLGFIYWRVS